MFSRKHLPGASKASNYLVHDQENPVSIAYPPQRWARLCALSSVRFATMSRRTLVRSLLFRVILCLFVAVLSSPVRAAPSVNYLFPAGAQRGKTVEVTAAGSFPAWPVRAWVSGQGVTATAGATRASTS